MKLATILLGVLLCVSIVSAQYQQPVFNIPSGTALANNDHPRLYFTDTTFDSEIIPRLEGANKDEWIAFTDAIRNGNSASNPNYEALSYAFACYALSRNISISDSSYNPPGLSSVCADAYSKVNGISQCDPERHEYANPYGDSKWGPRGCGLTLPFGYTLLMGSGQLTGGEQTTLQNKMRDIHNSASGDTIQYCVPTDSGYEGNRHPYVNSAFPDCFQYDMIGWVLYGSGVSNFDETEAINNVYDVMLLRFLDYQEGACGPDQGDTRYGTKLHGWCDLEGGAYRTDNFIDSALAAGAFGPGIGENYFRTNQFIRQMPEHFYNSIRAYKNDGVYQVYANDDGNQETLNAAVGGFGTALRMMVHYGDPNDEMTQLADWLIDIGPTASGVSGNILDAYVMNYFVGGSEHFTGASPDELNLDLLTSDGRYTMMRSGFSDLDTSVRVDQMKWNCLITHNKDTYGAFYMDRKGPLFVSTVPTKSGQCDRAGNGYVYGPAFSTFTGFNTGAHMSFNGKVGNFKMDTQTSSATLIEEENNPEYDVDSGDHIAFDEFSSTTLVTGWDYSKAYTGVDDATQYMVLFSNEPVESFVFEFNHMVDDLEAVKVLRGSDDLATVSTGGLSLARRYKMDNSDNGFSNSDVFVSVAYPLSPSYDDSGSPDWQDLNGNQPDNANPANSEGDPELCRAYYGDYTVRIKSSTEDSFVTVYHLVDVGGSADPVNRLSGTDMVGAVADSSNKDYVAMFSTLNDGELTSTGFTVTTNSESEYVLAGFEQSTTYTVDIGTESLSVTSSPGGVLNFGTTQTGTLSVSVGGGVAPDPCTDGTALGTCSSTQPLYCGSAGGSTTPNCQACGCSGTDTCQSDGTCLAAGSCTNGQTQSCSTGLSGVCSSGTQTCSGGSWGSCVQDNQATTEICSNGIDEDCNGADLACATCSEGEITDRCGCGSTVHETGYCCSDSHQTTPCGTTSDNDPDYNDDDTVDMTDFNLLDTNYGTTNVAYDLNGDGLLTLIDLAMFGLEFEGGGSTSPFCGDGTCNNGETSLSCPADCGAGPVCGDDNIDAGEECDDGSSNGVACTAPYDGTCDYCSSSCTTVTVTGPFCGDGSCSNGETSNTCSADCGSGGSGDELFVDKNNPSCSNSGSGSSSQPFCSIQSGINALSAGDTLSVRGSTSASSPTTYSEILSIGVDGTATNPVTIREFPGEHVRLATSDTSEFMITFSGGSSYVTMSGFELDREDRSRKAISIFGSYNTLDNMDIHSGVSDLITIRGSSTGTTVQNSEIYDTYLLGSSDAHCIVVDEGAVDVTIKDNTIYNCDGDGVQFFADDDDDPATDYSEGGLIENNHFYLDASHHVTKSVGENAIDLKGVNNLVIRGNIMHGFISNKALVAQKGVSGLLIENNTIYDSAAGMEFRGEDGWKQSGHIIRYNLIRDLFDIQDFKEYCLKFDDVGDTLVYHNTLITCGHNGFEAFQFPEQSLYDSEIRNNLMYDAGRPADTFSRTTNVIVSNNGWFDTDADLMTDPSDTTGSGDPGFVNIATNDYRITSSSVVVDQGVDVGLSFNGAAPDLGYYETN